MYFPIKIFTTEESYFKINLSIPVFLWFRTGFKPDGPTIRDRLFNPQMSITPGEDATCLHFYVFAFSLRMRSNKTMKYIKDTQPNRKPQRFTRFTFRGWAQVFNSAII